MAEEVCQRRGFWGQGWLLVCFKGLKGSDKMVEIEKYSFGRMVISGQEYREDLKIIQGRVVSGWWRRKGHRVTVQDVLDVFQAKPDILVVGRGRPGLMKVDPELAKALEKENIELVDKGTAKAVQEFNLLAGQGADVAGCFHLTC